MTNYAIRMENRVEAYVEDGDPRMLAVMQLLANFGCIDGMAEHVETIDNGRGGVRATIIYSRSPDGLDYVFGSGEHEATACAEVDDRDFVKTLGGPDLWTYEKWLDTYKHEALLARRAIANEDWQRDRDVDIADGTMPDIMHRY